jgi:calcineurin-like phosphoesterase family protein
MLSVIHNRFEGNDRFANQQINLAVEAWDYKPVSIETIIQTVKENTIG